MLSVRKETSFTNYLYYNVTPILFHFKQTSSKVLDVSVFFLAVLYSYIQQIIGMGVPVLVSFDYILLILTDTVGVCVKLMATFLIFSV